MTVFGAVFARGGSKGVPGKNLRLVAGKSLLQLSVDLGRATEAIDRLLVSTDSDDIAAAAMTLGAEVPFRRPAVLATDDSAEWLSWQNLAQHLIDTGASESDLLVSLPTTAPLREMEDVQQAIDLFNTSDFDAVLAVTESTVNPWFNMVTRDGHSGVNVLLGADGEAVNRRQDATAVFDITTVVYVTSLGYVLGSAGLFSGAVGSVAVPRERALDIDTDFDIEIANFLIRRKRGFDCEKP